MAKFVWIVLRHRWISKVYVAIAVFRCGLNLGKSIASINNGTLRGRNPRKWKCAMKALPNAIRIEITISQAASSSDSVLAKGASDLRIWVAAEVKCIAVDGIFLTRYHTGFRIVIWRDGPELLCRKITTRSTQVRTISSFSDN